MLVLLSRDNVTEALFVKGVVDAADASPIAMHRHDAVFDLGTLRFTKNRWPESIPASSFRDRKSREHWAKLIITQKDVMDALKAFGQALQGRAESDLAALRKA